MTPGSSIIAVGIVIGEQQSAEPGAPSFGIGPADDDKFLAVEAFDLEPQSAINVLVDMLRIFRARLTEDREFSSPLVDLLAVSRLLSSDPTTLAVSRLLSLNLVAISRLLLSTCSRFLVSSRRTPLAVPRLLSLDLLAISRLLSSDPLAVPRLLSSDPARGFSSPLVDRSRFLVSARRLLVVPSLLSSTTRGSPALPRLELSNRYTRRLEFPPIPPSLKFEGKSSPILTRLENARNNVSPDVNT
jgi:hypothetical protein